MLIYTNGMLAGLMALQALEELVEAIAWLYWKAYHEEKVPENFIATWWYFQMDKVL